MRCYVYRSQRKADTYIYLAVRDDFDPVPEAALKVFGVAEFALEFELTPERKLSQEDSREVMENLKTKGFHLQLPKSEVEHTILQKIIMGRD